MPEFKYLIVGGGMTAYNAVKGIRELDPDGSIGLLSMEPDPPYARPPLSKGLWKGETPSAIWLDMAGTSAQLLLNCQVAAIDPKAQTVTGENDQVYGYEKLLLATGARPRRFTFGGNDVIYYRTWRDYQRLHELAAQAQNFAVIGGGYIGSEVVAALAMNGKRVTLFMIEDTLFGTRFPAELGEFVTDYFRQKGVVIVPHSSIANIEKQGAQLVVKSRDEKDRREQSHTFDAVVAGLGAEPNVDLAKEAGIQVDNGILVDEHLRTNHLDIYAAGDVASVYRPLLGKRMRVEHEDNSNTMGRAAGRNMAGAHEPYTYQPFFYSDLFDLGFEAVGELGARMQKVSDWKEPFREGVIYYLHDNRVRGVVLWNVWGKLNLARELIAEPGPFTADNLIGRIKF